jgi:hypothetical protein
MLHLQPEESILMKKGGKIKQKQKQKQRQSVNIKNIITIDKKTPTRRKGKTAQKRQSTSPPQQQFQAPGVQYPFINLLRPQSNEPRGVSLTGATAGEANNNVMATVRKAQEITEGKLNTRIDDMQSKLVGDFDSLSRVVVGIHQFLSTYDKDTKQKPKQLEEKKEEKKEEYSASGDLIIDGKTTMERYLERKKIRERRLAEREQAEPPDIGLEYS